MHDDLNNSPQDTTLAEFIHSANERMEIAGQSAANQAFNLGCSIGLIPAILFVLITFMMTKGSWLATAIMTLLMLLALAGVANLAADIARTRNIARVFQEDIQPEIIRRSEAAQLSQEELKETILETLSQHATLYKYLATAQTGKKFLIFRKPNQ